MIGAVRESVAELGSGRAVSGFQLLRDNVDRATSTLRFVTGLVAILALSAALLSALGLYAVVSFVVHQRRRATAIRSALGATPARLVRHHLRNGGAVLLVAVPVGVALSLVSARFLGSLVYGIDIYDAQSLTIAALLAATIGMLGTYLPARGAVKDDPARALRAE